MFCHRVMIRIRVALKIARCDDGCPGCHCVKCLEFTALTSATFYHLLCKRFRLPEAKHSQTGKRDWIDKRCTTEDVLRWLSMSNTMDFFENQNNSVPRRVSKIWDFRPKKERKKLTLLKLEDSFLRRKRGFTERSSEVQTIFPLDKRTEWLTCPTVECGVCVCRIPMVVQVTFTGKCS